ncbi:hypothetical protein NI392_17300 [Vibrio alginolyticus]|nr:MULTISPECIES: hypothetical protein [Vibrio]MDW1972779.1 hypothetical protein [Vibrio sp. 945]EIC9816386.1 hypothetical protein [Vibrio alginolyticus]EII5414537.1 hypothetical protein [Vibrio alginolyticus]EJL6726685.1 hypothetical protein [Vibrio alginolyticus]ELN6885371.1 hypothetical protein [Vibrio alginolyticus]
MNAQNNPKKENRSIKELQRFANLLASKEKPPITKEPQGMMNKSNRGL